MKRLLYLLGIALCVLAFFGAAAEMAAQAMDPAIGWWPGTLRVWRTVSPDTFAAFAAALDGTPAWLAVLRLPPWLIPGAPGIALVVVFRRRGQGNWQDHEDALYLYDELAGRAHAEGFDAHGRDDMAPSDPDDVVPAEDHYADDFDAGDFEDDEPDSRDGTPPRTTDNHDFLLDPKSPATDA